MYSFFLPDVFGFLSMVCNLPLQVQGDARDVVASLQQVLDQLSVAAMVDDEYDATGEGSDDDDDPADYPGLFTDDVSCLMLLLPWLMMCYSSV